MSLIPTLAAIVLPVFMVVGAGYGAVRSGVLPDAGIDPLMNFAFKIAVPGLLFLAMYDLDLGATMRASPMVAFYGASIACFVGAALISRHLLGRRKSEAVAVGFAAMFGNSLLLGIPIIERAYDEAALAAGYALISFTAPLFFAIGILSMEILRSDGGSVGQVLRRAGRTTLSNPLMVGIGLGLAANLVDLPLPGPIYDTIAMLARAALPVAVFALGGVLTRYALKAEIGEALMISVFSLVVKPGLAWVVADAVFGLPEPFVQAAVVLAAMPPGINGYVFASMYDRAVGTAASAVLLGTMLSIVSITLWLALLGGTALG